MISTRLSNQRDTRFCGLWTVYPKRSDFNSRLKWKFIENCTSYESYLLKVHLMNKRYCTLFDVPVLQCFDCTTSYEWIRQLLHDAYFPRGGHLSWNWIKAVAFLQNIIEYLFSCLLRFFYHYKTFNSLILISQLIFIFNLLTIT